MKALVLLVLAATSLQAQQRKAPFEQQMQENQRRLEGIRRERSTVEEELSRLRTQAHSLADELANIDRQKQTTNQLVNELDRQINGLGGQIDQTTVDLLLAEDALLEKRAVLERRLVDIHKRGPMYSYEVLLTAESFGDLLSRYKYLFLISRQDRLLANDMDKLRRRIARERTVLVEARDQLERRRRERTQELDRFLALERERGQNLRETRRGEREAQRRLTQLERDEREMNDRIAALERARREAEARGVTSGRGTITTADIGQLGWPVDGRLLYQFGTDVGPNNTRIPRHGIGIGAPVGTPVKSVAGGTASVVGRMSTYLLTIILDHGGGYYSVYAQLDSARVKQGDRVIAGQVIGTVGGASSDEGSHLYFEIRGQGGIVLDPINWLKQRR